MQRTVSYARQTVDSPNPLARLAHRTRLNRSLAISRRYLAAGSTFVDFGAGTGLLLRSLRQSHPDAHLVGIEPFMTPLYPDCARYLTSLVLLEPRSVDVVGAFEVCEHLYEREICEVLDQSRKVLRREGRLLVSVPIMYGITVAAKVLNRIILYRENNTDYTVRDIVRSTVGIRIARPESPRHTHAGFDFRWLSSLVKRYFDIERVEYSPFDVLPWYFNSQIFFICTQRDGGVAACSSPASKT